MYKFGLWAEFSMYNGARRTFLLAHAMYFPIMAIWLPYAMHLIGQYMLSCIFCVHTHSVNLCKVVKYQDSDFSGCSTQGQDHYHQKTLLLRYFDEMCNTGEMLSYFSRMEIFWKHANSPTLFCLIFSIYEPCASTVHDLVVNNTEKYLYTCTI